VPGGRGAFVLGAPPRRGFLGSAHAILMLADLLFECGEHRVWSLRSRCDDRFVDRLPAP